MITITDKQKVTLTLIPKTKAGNLAKIDGIPVWGVDDVNIASLSISSDGLSAVASSSSPGNTIVFAFADANLNEGIREVLVEIEINVVDSQNLLTISSSSPINL